MGRLMLRVPPLRRISYMTPMRMPSGMSWLSWEKAVSNLNEPSRYMTVAPTRPKSIHPTEARYICDSFSTCCSRPVLRRRRLLTMTAASMAVMPPTYTSMVVRGSSRLDCAGSPRKAL